MEVKINSQFVIAERERRAWSQQHLADAAGLALRTIQRIESGGTGSYESLRAVAACFEVPVEALRAADESPMATTLSRPGRARMMAASVIGASLLAGFAGFLWLGTASAAQVLVNLGLTIEQAVVAENAKPGRDVQHLETQLLLGDGEAKELPVEGKLKLVITPTILTDGRILLAAKLYEQRGAAFELVGEPRMVADDGGETQVVFPVGQSAQRIYRINFKPAVQGKAD